MYEKSKNLKRLEEISSEACPERISLDNVIIEVKRIRDMAASGLENSFIQKEINKLLNQLEK